MSTNEDYRTLEELKRLMVDPNIEFIEAHGLQIVQSKVEMHKSHGLQMVIIIKVGDKK